MYEKNKINKMVSMDFHSIYKTLTFYSIGGLWGYAIMHIQDNNNETKIRLAKCKSNFSFPETERGEWVDLDPFEINNLSQVSRINFKKIEELEVCYLKLKELFDK